MNMHPHAQVYNLCVSQGVNLFDTADSYGTGKLAGKSEQLLVSRCQFCVLMYCTALY